MLKKKKKKLPEVHLKYWKYQLEELNRSSWALNRQQEYVKIYSKPDQHSSYCEVCVRENGLRFQMEINMTEVE